MFNQTQEFVSHSDAPSQSRTQGRADAAVLLPVAVVFLAILVAVWTPIGIYNTAAVLTAALCILGFTAVESNSFRQLGLARPASGIATTLLAGTLAVTVVIGLGVLLRASGGPPHPVPWSRAWQYVLWALMQEFILQSFFYTHLERVVGSRTAVLWAAVLFSLVHIPSPILTVLTLFGGIFFCELFRRHRNLYPLGLVHGVLGLTVAAAFPDSLLHHMRVGIGYLLYHH